MHTVSRAIIAYFFLLLMMRVMGRRAPVQMTPFEIIIILLFGGMAAQAIIDTDHSLTNAFIGIVTVAIVHLLVSSAKLKYRTFRKIVDGSPLVLFSKGQWHREVMAKKRILDQDVMAQARKSGIQNEDEIKYAILERNGSISIIKAKQ